MAWGKFLTLWSVLTTVTALATLHLTGPYDITLTRMENCSEPDSNDFTFDLSKTKKNTRWAVFSGTTILKKDIDENVSLEGVVYYKTAFGYVKFLDVVVSNACVDFKRKFVDSAMFILSSLGLDTEECPIKAGVYKAEFNTTVPNFREFPGLIYGDFKLVLVFKENNPPSRIGCLAGYLTVSERPLS